MELTGIEKVLAEVQADNRHEWLMTTAQVSEGYGVSPSTVRTHKSAKAEELIEGQHWIKNEKGGTLWTKRGAIQLGFCIQSERGAEFRRRAEEWVVEGMNRKVRSSNAVEPAPQSAPIESGMVQSGRSIGENEVDDLCRQIARQVGPEVARRMLAEGVQRHLPAEIEKGMEPAGKALGAALSLQYGLDLTGLVSDAVERYLNPVEVTE